MQELVQENIKLRIQLQKLLSLSQDSHQIAHLQTQLQLKDQGIPSSPYSPKSWIASSTSFSSLPSLPSSKYPLYIYPL